MNDRPTIDGRTPQQVFDHLRAIAPYYTDEWDPSSEDIGTALCWIFAEMAGDVVTRLDQVPEKHRISFFETLGFDREPPQPARVPVTFRIADGVEENVEIPAGTQVVAEETETRAEQTFEVQSADGFEATPANLVGAYAVDQKRDRIFDHETALIDGATTARELFEGTDEQEHAIYVGHDDLLNVRPETDLSIELKTDAPANLLRTGLVWEYFGTAPGDDSKRWRELQPPEQPALAPRPPPIGTIRERIEETLLPRIDERARELDVALAESEATRLVNYITDATRGRRTELRTLDWRDAIELDVVSDTLPFAPGFLEDLETVFAENPPREVFELPKDPPEPPVERGVDRVPLDVSGEISPTEVDETESRWIRCTVPKSGSDGQVNASPSATRIEREELFDVELDSVSLVATRSGFRPDAALSNDVPLELKADPKESVSVYPFGEVPRPLDTFYLASEEAFTKRGAEVTLTFESAGEKAAASSPRLSWEYWNGGSWTRIESEQTPAKTDLLRDSVVSFTVPDDLTSTSVAGQEGHWIRVRLVDGEYTRTNYKLKWTSWQPESTGAAPELSDVRITYSRKEPVTHLVTKNNLASSRAGGGASLDRLRPFVRPPDDKQTLYLGFDGPLDNGPLALSFAMVEREYPESFYPRIRWEYCTNPARDVWSRMNPRDGTESLTESGIVRFVLPEATATFDRFGRSLHWLRARVVGDEFTAGPVTRPPVGGSTTDADDERDAADVRLPCGSTLETAPASGRPTRRSPALTGIHPNTGWAHNVRTVPDELLGSSDGTANQTFRCGSPPLVDEEVWVDELSVLSEGERRALTREDSERIEETVGPEGEATAFWVRWHRVDDFIGTGPDARAFASDRSVGVVRFGDGENGKIPPTGRDNVRATYETGGGVAGNVASGEVSKLKSSIAFVDGVVNHAAGDGGADGETTAEVLGRAPKALRDRDKAVGKGDFERIAQTASRKLARVRCLPGMDEFGERKPGWVTVLVVPRTQEPKPVPSIELRRRVLGELRRRAPATLVEPDQLVVRGPSYVTATVRTTLVAEPGESVSALETRTTDRLAAYLHPLTGGDDADGWTFGDLPCLSDFYALLENTEGVDHVRHLAVTFGGTEADVTVTEGETPPSVSADALVYSGTHDVRAEGGR